MSGKMSLEELHKIAYKIKDEPPKKSVLKNTIKGGAIGVLGSAGVLGGASLAYGKGVGGKVLRNVADGALHAFNPSDAKKGIQMANSFRKSGTLGKIIKGVTNGKGVARGYGSAIGVGAGALGAGIGALSSMSQNSKKRSIEQRSEHLAELLDAFDSMEKTAMKQKCNRDISNLREFLSSAKPMEKNAGIASTIARIGATSAAKRTMVGAGIGAGIGALRSRPTIDEYGNKSGGMLSGAIKGAILGGVGGHAFNANVASKATNGLTKLKKFVGMPAVDNVAKGTTLKEMSQTTKGTIKNYSRASKQGTISGTFNGKILKGAPTQSPPTIQPAQELVQPSVSETITSQPPKKMSIRDYATMKVNNIPKVKGVGNYFTH